MKKAESSFLCRIRKTAQLKEGTSMSIKTKGKMIILEPIEPVADKYFGAFKVTKLA